MIELWPDAGAADAEAYCNARQHLFIGEAARLLCIARTDKELSDDDITTMVDRLADVAERHGVSPDLMAHMLAEEQPELLEDWNHIIPETL